MRMLIIVTIMMILLILSYIFWQVNTAVDRIEEMLQPVNDVIDVLEEMPRFKEVFSA